MNANITSINNINNNIDRAFNKYLADYADIPCADFDEIADIENVGWTVVACNDTEAIAKALRQTRDTGVRRWYPRKNFTFIVDNKGRGYAAKAEQKELRSEEILFGCKFKTYEYFVSIIPVIDIANIGFAVLEQVRRQRGGDEGAHVADGYWLRNIIGAPEEFLADIEAVQPVEVRALRELRQIRRDFKKAADKATEELMKLAKTDETVTLRTFKFHEKIEVAHFDLNYFEVVDTEGDKDIWSLRTICLATNILDII